MPEVRTGRRDKQTPVGDIDPWDVARLTPEEFEEKYGWRYDQPNTQRTDGGGGGSGEMFLDPREEDDGGYPEEILDILREGSAEDKRRYEALLPGAQDISAAGATANLQEQRLLAEMRGKESGLDDILAPGYRGDYTSAAAGATADPDSIRAQRQALNEYRKNLGTGLTDAERSMMELTRRKQEREQRASREAALSDIQSRGFASGGDEIAAMLGTQQETGERRMLEDLATRGEAVGRAERARAGLAGLGSQMRSQSYTEAYGRGTAADEAARHNADMRSAYDQWTTGLAQSERDKEWGRGMDIFGAEAGTIGNRYDRASDPWEYKAGVTSGMSGSSASNRNALVQALSARYGAEQAEEAADAMKPKPTLMDKLNPLNWF